MPKNKTMQYLDTQQGRRIAWMGGEVADKPTIVFFPGHGSDMEGSKALAVAQWADTAGVGIIRFDYSGHGQSSGALLDGTIGDWKDDCLSVIDQLTRRPLIIIGSSLGGWLMMLVARVRSERLQGLIGIAAAPDFTQRLIWDTLTPAQRISMQKDGQIALPNPYAPEDVIYPYQLITEARNHLVLESKTVLNCPVRLLHGEQDEEVPPDTANQIRQSIESPDIEVIFKPNAGHRFSAPDEIDLLLSCLDEMVTKTGAAKTGATKTG